MVVDLLVMIWILHLLNKLQQLEKIKKKVHQKIQEKSLQPLKVKVQKKNLQQKKHQMKVENLLKAKKTTQILMNCSPNNF